MKTKGSFDIEVRNSPSAPEPSGVGLHPVGEPGSDDPQRRLKEDAEQAGLGVRKAAGRD